MPTTLKMIGKIKGKKILDIGCGPGLYAKKLKEMGAEVKGIDISEKTAVCMQILTIAVMHKNDTVEQTLKHTDKMLHKLNLSSILDQES